MNDDPHELMRASNVLRRRDCPGSARMEAGIPDEEDNSEIAAEGTLLHRLDADPSLSRAKLTHAQRDLLNTSARLTKEVFQRVGDQFGVSDVTPDLGGFEREMFLHKGIRWLFSGHCDAWEYFAELKLLVILEKKFGFLPVDPASANMQTRAYACMGAEIHDCENVVCAITQPRLPRDEQLTLAVYDREQIKASREQLFAIWEACNKPDAPLVAGENQCRYCRAKLVCDAYKSKFLAISEGINRSTVATAQHSLAQLSDDQLERVLIAIQFAGFIEKHAKDVARERISAGRMPGWKLGRESEVREVTDVPAAMALLTAAGVSADSLRPALKMKIGDVEDAYRDAHDKMTWKDAKDQVNDILGDLIERHKKAPSVERVK